MTVVIIVVILGAAAILVLARQYLSGMSDRRSVERYERGLGHLGEVTRRSDAVSSRTPTPDSEIAPVHLGPLSRSVPPPRPPRAARAVPVAPKPPIADEPDVALVFGDEDLLPARARTASDRPRRSARPNAPRSPRATGGSHRPAVLIAAPVVVIAAAGIVAAEVFGNGSNVHSGTRPPANGATTGPATSPTAPTTTTLPDTYTPASVTNNVVTYNVPAGTHTVTFNSTGVCWVGVESSSSGPYLWMDTIAAGQNATYSSSGSVVVRIGAPLVVSVAIDGVPVVFPKGQVQPFDFALGTGSGSSAGA